MILAAKRIVDDVDPNKLTERLFRRGAYYAPARMGCRSTFGESDHKPISCGRSMIASTEHLNASPISRAKTRLSLDILPVLRYNDL